MLTAGGRSKFDTNKKYPFKVLESHTASRGLSSAMTRCVRPTDATRAIESAVQFIDSRLDAERRQFWCVSLSLFLLIHSIRISFCHRLAACYNETVNHRQRSSSPSRATLSNCATPPLPHLFEFHPKNKVKHIQCISVPVFSRNKRLRQ